MIRGGHGLYSRIYLHLLGVLLVVGLAASLLIATGQRSAFQRQIAERLVRHAAGLVAERWHDRPGLVQRLEQTRRDLEIDLTVRDAAGALVAAAGPPIRPLDGEERARVAAGGTLLQGGPAWLAATVLRDPASGAAVGVLEVSAPPRLRIVALWRPVLGVAALLLVIGLAAAPLARRISRPIERLTDAARRLGAGDLAVRVPVDGAGRRRWRRGGRDGNDRRRGDEIEALTRAFNEMAERLGRLVDGHRELLANVSHELRSPLARVRLALALVPRTGEGDARLRDVETDLAELERLIDDVLTTSRLGAIGLPPHPAPVDVRALLGDVAARARHDPATAGTTVAVAPGPDLPLVGDAGLLRRALWNLVENAAKYGLPPVVLAAERQGEHAALSVTDRGPGIRPEERERVLAPFQRGDRARTPDPSGARPSGFGLGLTLARRVAEVHGGTIVIESPHPGPDAPGCRVTLLLPSATLPARA